MSGLNGYAQLRRGVYAHLHAIGDLEWKVYCACLMGADPRTGVFRFTISELAADLGKGRSSVAGALRSLASERPVRTEKGTVNRRYIDYSPTVNQHKLSEVTILNFSRSAVSGSGTAPGTAPGTAAAQQPHSSRTAAAQHTTSDLQEDASYSLKAIKALDKPSENDDVPESVSLYASLLQTYQRVTCKVPSQNDRRVIQGWATFRKSPEAVEDALKAAIDNKARNLAAYATAILDRGPQPQDDYEPFKGVNLV